ncbi:hypothetical protein [Motiliproteus sp. MSK22-1]|uniref:hypothetical protein n=1 Tax=Motiliproteus sp. MSK22-1 TaxID=1897630 RepID=UPI00117D860A|nr:hypothetical protein [Motiliproteus sp. MSK22-1]
MKKKLIISTSIILLFVISIAIYLYIGTYRREVVSPNGEYVLKYYNTIDITNTSLAFRECRAQWVRLYTKSGKKLNEKLTDICKQEGRINWSDSAVSLSDGRTVWELPSPAE